MEKIGTINKKTHNAKSSVYRRTNFVRNRICSKILDEFSVYGAFQSCFRTEFFERNKFPVQIGVDLNELLAP